MKNLLNTALVTIALGVATPDAEAQMQRTVVVRQHLSENLNSPEDSLKAVLMSRINEDIKKLAAQSGYTVIDQNAAQPGKVPSAEIIEAKDVGFQFDLIKVYTGNRFSHDDYPNADGSFFAKGMKKGDKFVFVNRKTKQLWEKKY